MSAHSHAVGARVSVLMDGRRRIATIRSRRHDSLHAYEVVFEDTGLVQVVWDNPAAVAVHGAASPERWRSILPV